MKPPFSGKREMEMAEMRETVNRLGVRLSQGDVLLFEQQGRGRWTAEGRHFYYWVLKNEALWSTVVVDKDDQRVVERNDVTTRHRAQEVAEQFEELEPEFSLGRQESGMTRMARANLSVMVAHYPDEPKKWTRRIPSNSDLSFLGR